MALKNANKQKHKECLSPKFLRHLGKQEGDTKPVEISFFDIPDFHKLSINQKDTAVLERIDMSNKMSSSNDFKLCLENRLRNSLKAMIKKFPKEFNDFVSLQSDVILSSLDDYTIQDIGSAYQV